MIPVVTPDEMAAIDRAAADPVEILIERAGAAVARAAVRMLGGTYGRTVVVIAGKGNNGKDGRAAARRLVARGVKVIEIDAVAASGERHSGGRRLPPCDLVIDAAYGTGFRGTWDAPLVEPGTPVLGVDIPSGVDGLTGAADGPVLRADRTVTFAALKPGLVLHPGAELAGVVEVADIGLDVSRASIHVVQAADAARWYPPRHATSHKWQAAAWVIGGSAGLQGAAVLTSSAAMRGGAGYVRWSSPGETPSLVKPTEVVGTELPSTGWAAEVLDGAARFAVIALGNGLGLDERHGPEVRRIIGEASTPVIVDADAITLWANCGTLDSVGRTGETSTILTPHEGEFDRLFAPLFGRGLGHDRIADTRALASRLNAIVLLKGATTVVAEPGGRVLICTAGDQRLATLGTGDVLAGIIAAMVARGAPCFEAAAAAAFIHASAGALGWRNGLVAGDLVDLLPAAIDAIVAPPAPPGSALV